jgi:hypothetical protein
MTRDLRLTPTTVLMIQPRHSATDPGGFWMRLVDPASGCAQPEWTLAADAWVVQRYADSFGVEVKIDPETGEDDDQ